jgi:hypothetical protein
VISTSWCRSDGRTWLPPNCLQTGNFSGNFTKSKPKRFSSLLEKPEPLPLPSEFPAENNRERILGNRHFSVSSRNFDLNGEARTARAKQNSPIMSSSAMANLPIALSQQPISFLYFSYQSRTNSILGEKLISRRTDSISAKTLLVGKLTPSRMKAYHTANGSASARSAQSSQRAGVLPSSWRTRSHKSLGWKAKS